jgi:hypothetical protein
MTRQNNGRLAERTQWRTNGDEVRLRGSVPNALGRRPFARSRSFSRICEDSLDLVVTSPPFRCCARRRTATSAGSLRRLARLFGPLIAVSLKSGN